MFHTYENDRRQHKRYFVKGQARVRLADSNSAGELFEILNVSASGLLSHSGLLLLSKTSFPDDTDLEIRFTIQGYNAEIQAKGRLVRSDVGTVGIMFVEEPAGISDLVAWLEAELMATLL